ncbi:hypothetical protein Areg01_40130 [Actinoplanes regularis]|nr:hypothetical protein Areg01_40130 [Actinoplanes regularis]
MAPGPGAGLRLSLRAARGASPIRRRGAPGGTQWIFRRAMDSRWDHPSMDNNNLGLCPYCQSDQIIRLEGGMKDGYLRSGVAVSTFKTVEFVRLICLQCGSVREWVANQKDLDLLREKYGPARA